MKLLYDIIKYFTRIYMRIFYHYKIINPERLEDLKGCIIAANHISANDPLFLGAIIPKQINYLAKSELFRNPILAAFLKKMGVISIRRGKVDRKAIELVENNLNSGHMVIMFPEGTRKSTKVKAGIGKMALETRKDILPLYIKNSDRFKDCFWGKSRMYIVVGEWIKIEDFIAAGIEKENYRRIADHTMQKIFELENECKNS